MNLFKASIEPPKTDNNRLPTSNQRNYSRGGMMLLLFALLIYPIGGLYISIGIGVFAISVIWLSLLTRTED